MSIAVYLVLLLLLSIRLTSLASEILCACVGSTVENPREACRTSIDETAVSGQKTTNVTGCGCADADFVPLATLTGINFATVQCVHWSDVEEFFNTTNATTTEKTPTGPLRKNFRYSSLTLANSPSSISTKKTMATDPSFSSPTPSEKQAAKFKKISEVSSESTAASARAFAKEIKTDAPGTPDQSVTVSAVQNVDSTAQTVTKIDADGKVIVGGVAAGIGGDRSNATEAPEDGIQESPHRCNNTNILQVADRRVVKSMLYFTTAWIVLWCVISILFNLWRENGHHRYVNFIQELGIIVLFAVIGTCSLNSFNERASCQVTSHIISASVAWIMASFFMEGISANRIVKGRTERIGWGQTVFNTVFPIVALWSEPESPLPERSMEAQISTAFVQLKPNSSGFLCFPPGF
ncbi:hypothetical protein L596_003852 [Steinernema carpocapsae]|uniref:G-protein coupled receptors family 2 profile 2 domain-containing protein n=1 Tax=Steinernema carpocapsae TaxID=34508 RepID=A0A4U8UVH5_STECR|nr:hypothetical protein L596_003852 [Steinernema carpocapsae]